MADAAVRSPGLGSRFGRRLFLVFVMVALVPLAASDLLASHVVHDVLRTLDRASRERQTDQVAFQVLDRLLTAKTLLRALPLRVPAPDGSPPGLGKVFDSLELLGPDGSASWSSRQGTGLLAAWTRAGRGSAGPVRRGTVLDGPGLRVELRENSLPGRVPQVLLAALQGDHPRWIADVDPAFLWGPVQEAVADNDWSVRNGRGLLLFKAPSGATAGAGGRSREHFSHRLFLSAEFGAPDWVFAQQAPRPEVRWLGWPLATWLGLVAAATLIAIAMLTLLQLRRTLVPLGRLTQGTRRLAAGDTGARVEPSSDDEIAELARSFNDMAARIGAQFDALKGLAAIDRAILSGASVESLGRQLLEQLRIHYPDAATAVAWQDGPGMLRVALPGARDALNVALDVESARAWDSLAAHPEGRVLDPRSPGALQGMDWLRELAPAAAACVAVFPLSEKSHTRAVVALAPAQAPRSGELRHAQDLRDRLAVGLAARARESDLVHQATHDSLTGLLNRDGLQQRFDALLARGATAPLAVLYVDLDHFKDVNDSRGHDLGDMLLRQATERLLASVPPGAVVARQGGDEFVVLLSEPAAGRAVEIAEVLIKVLASPFELPGSEHVVGASIGIAMAPLHARSRDELLRCADIALYSAKAAGRGRAMLFSAELDLMTRSRVERVAELRHALDRHELVAYYQPRVRVGDHAVVSAEALVRWNHPQRGLVMPGEFIALAEAAGLIHRIGGFMLDRACAQLADWRAGGLGIDYVSVNVSAEQLRSGDFCAQVREALARHGVPASALELEITESLLIGDHQQTFEQLDSLRELGVRIALDDFGTGYSSMAALRTLPVDVMKIDRSFVVDLGVDASALPIIQAIVALAKASGLRLIAEGVENSDQAQYLSELGCDELQGFLFGRAIPADAFKALKGVRRISSYKPGTGPQRGDDR